MGKPVEFYLKGEGTISLLKKDLKKYLKALTLQEDIICINVDTPKASKIFPIMRKEFSLADPAHMITPGPTVSSKPRELLADVLIQKVLMPPNAAG